MNPKTVQQSEPASGSGPPMFDHERQDGYQLELQFVSWLTSLFQEVKDSGKPRTSEAFDQLDRASLSALLNTAEGNGKRQRQVRAKFFDDARGSATECAACLDALVAKGVCDVQRIHEGKALLVRIVSILSKLVERFDCDAMLREDPLEYRVEATAEPRRSKVRYTKSRPRTRTRTKEI